MANSAPKSPPVRICNMLMSDEWPGYMVSKHSRLVAPRPFDLVRATSKRTQHPNAKIGQSADFPMRTGANQTFLKGSRSIFYAAGEPSEERPEGPAAGAGLSPTNTMHGYLCVNGDPKRPLVLANFLKTGAR